MPLTSGAGLSSARLWLAELSEFPNHDAAGAGWHAPHAALGALRGLGTARCLQMTSYLAAGNVGHSRHCPAQPEQAPAGIRLTLRSALRAGWEQLPAAHSLYHAEIDIQAARVAAQAQ